MKYRLIAASLACVIMLLIVTPFTVKAVSAEVYFSGGSSLCRLQLTTTSIFASNAATYDDEELFDPAVSLSGTAYNPNSVPLGTVSAQGYGICQNTNNNLVNVYSGRCYYYVNGSLVTTLYTTVNG